MKHALFSILIAAVLLSCAGPSENDLRGKSVEGTYVLQSESEFSIAADTLNIKAIENQKDLYAIERHVGYSRITENGDQAKKTKQEKAIAIWSAKDSKLKEQKHGRIYSLSEDGKRLQLGSTFYTKTAGQ